MYLSSLVHNMLTEFQAEWRKEIRAAIAVMIEGLEDSDSDVREASLNDILLLAKIRMLSLYPFLNDLNVRSRMAWGHPPCSSTYYLHPQGPESGRSPACFRGSLRLRSNRCVVHLFSVPVRSNRFEAEYHEDLRSAIMEMIAALADTDSDVRLASLNSLLQSAEIGAVSPGFSC
jgi:hypothetical protein